MSDEQDARDAQRWFASALGDEPAGSVDVDAAVRTGEQRLRHRRMWAVGGVAAAVTVGVVGVGLGTRWIGGTTVTPAAVPGCSTVVSTTDPAYLEWKFGPGGQPSVTPDTGIVTSQAEIPSASGVVTTPSWDTDDYRQRAVSSVVSALPSGVVEFTPSPSPDDHGADGAPGGEYWGTEGTSLTVQRADGSRQARLTLNLMGPWPDGPPPCSETVLYRLSTTDGTVVDVQDGGSGGLVAETFFSDGSLVSLTLQPAESDTGQARDQLPMTAEQLAQVAASPGLSLAG